MAFHNDHKAVCKYMQPLLVGLLKDEEKKEVKDLALHILKYYGQ